ncbi:N-acetylornithine carbamoyltransferase [Candidatus Micrarchaeota archaeon]|nr:N-acetylornithine carbamoyltransferase [Candidatus Micrarchaeota archaeon]
MDNVFKGKSFISTQDWKKADIEKLLLLAEKVKKARYSEKLKNKSMAMVFFNPSLRTRVSMQLAIEESGGKAVELNIGQGTWKLEHIEGALMDGDCTEHIKDAAKVLSRYSDAIAVRSFPEMKNWEQDKKDAVVNGFAKHSEVPVINMESALYHPCQALADIMTMKEKLGHDLKKKKFVLAWAYHPKALPMAVPNSAALISSMFGMNVTIAHPPGFELDSEIMSAVKKNCELEGGKLEVVNELDKAVEDAHIVYAKSWGSLKHYGNLEKEKELR